MTAKLVLVAGLVAGISLPLYGQFAGLGLEYVIFRELYFLPIMLAAFWFGLRGGLGVALGVSLLFLPMALRGHPEVPGRQGADLMDLALFNLVGLLLGLMRQRLARQQVQVQKAQALSVVAQTVANLALDMKNPIMAIGGLSGQVRRQLPDDHPAIPKLEQIIEQSTRLESMVHRMLDFGRPLELRLDQVDLPRLVRQCLELAAPLALKRRVELTSDLAVPPQAMRLDAFHLQQALLNLITNAIQASPPGGRVTVRLQCRGREAWLGVLDQGSGIEPPLRERVQEPFFTTKPNGGGLGLPLARRVAEAHGGRLVMEGNQPAGMVFSLVLPLAGGPPPAL